MLIELGLEECPDAISNPWSVIIETGDTSPQPLPEGTKVIDIFDQIGTGRTLLILGEPGSGKTTTLLELTRDLIDRAEQDVNLLIPVVFHLSFWANKRQKIADWLVEELNSKYKFPEKIGQAWITQQQLLPLLDGLDEVKAEYRDECIAALNTFYQNYGAELVVCSRIKDYEALSQRLEFQSAIYIKLLSLEQIFHYLDSIGADLAGLRALMVEDTVLQELAQSPLMLNIMTLAYQGVAVEDLPKSEVVEERRRQLFDDYIKEMFNRPNRSKVEQKYSEFQTIRWLIWLAFRMVQESQTVFLIEEMQPKWLHDKLEIIIYLIGNFLIFGLILGLILGLNFGLISGLNFGLIFGVLHGLIMGLGFTSIENIKTVEILKWSWEKAKNGLIYTLIRALKYGLIIGLILGLIFGLDFGLIIGLIYGLIIGLIYGLSGGLIAGLMSGMQGSSVARKTMPNQGIYRTARNAGIIGLILGLIYGLTSGLTIELTSGLTIGLTSGLTIGLTSGLTSGLTIGLMALIIGGGKACIQHFTLRLILYYNNYIPWNYARFLDYAADLIFLQKVGGGYIFIHRMLLEHFAKMELETLHPRL